MIRKIEHIQKLYVKNHSVTVFKDQCHFETHKVTTWYFLFIPVFKSKTLLSHALD